MSDTPLTPEQRRALARAPITVGILASLGVNHYSGKSHAGSGGDGTKAPIVGRDEAQVVGWRRVPVREH